MALPPVPVGYLDGSLLDNSEEIDIAVATNQLGGSKSTITCTEATEPLPELTQDEIECIKHARKWPAYLVRIGMRAAADGDMDTLGKLLHDYSFDPARCFDHNHSNMLHWAAGGGVMQVIDALIYGVPPTRSSKLLSINAGNKSGRTPIQWAARNGKAKCCEWLQDNGADVFATTSDGVNVFHWAVFSQDIDTCRWASKCGVDICAVNRWGCYATHWAAATGCVELCEFVKQLGLDFGIRNNQGHDGLCKATWNGHTELALWMLQNHSPSLESQQQLALSHDRAGISALELARINGHVATYNKLVTVLQLEHHVSSTTRGDVTTVSICPNQEFIIFYRTQTMIFNERNWNAYLKASSAPLKVFAYVRAGFASHVLATLGHWVSSKIVRVLLPEQLPRILPKDAMLLYLSRSDWVRSAELSKLFERLSKLGTLVLGESDTDFAHSLVVSSLLTSHAWHTNTTTSVGKRILYMLASPSAGAELIVDAMSGVKDCMVIVNGLDGKQFLGATTGLRKDGPHSTPSCLLTIGNPRKFPCMFISTESDVTGIESNATVTESDIGENEYNKANTQLLFNRIVTGSAQCSQDGTMRSKPHLWKEWSIANGLKNHAILLKSLLRGLHMLAEVDPNNLVEKPGILLYKTHSLNPIENEAVVAAALERYKGSVYLETIDKAALANCFSYLDEDFTSFANGVASWSVPDPTVVEGHSLFRFLSSWSDLPAQLQSDESRNPLRTTMFPPDDITITEQLSRCLRILPQETGSSFGAGFVAMFCKRSGTHQTANVSDWFVGETTPSEAVVPASTKRRVKLEKGQLQKQPKYSKRYLMFDTEQLKDMPWLKSEWNNTFEFYGLRNLVMLTKSNHGGNKLQVSFAAQYSNSVDTLECLEQVQGIAAVSNSAAQVLINQHDLVSSGFCFVSAGSLWFVPLPRAYEKFIRLNEHSKFRLTQSGASTLGARLTRRVIRFDLIQDRSALMTVATKGKVSLMDIRFEVLLESGCISFAQQCEPIARNARSIVGGVVLCCGNNIYLTAVLGPSELQLFCGQLMLERLLRELEGVTK